MAARARFVARICAALAASLGAAGLAGRLLDVPMGEAAMKVPTAAALLVAGATLWAAVRGAGSSAWTRAGAAAVGLSGLLGLWQNLAGAPDPQRISGISAVSLLLASIALASGRGRGAGTAQALALSWAALNMVSLLGYLYAADDLHLLHLSMRNALSSALAFVALAAGILAARPDAGVTKLVGGDTAGGASARRLLPAFLVLPIVIGWLRIEGERAGLFGAALGVTLVAVTYMVALSALTLWSASALRDAEAARRAAHEELRESEARFRRLLENAPDLIYRYRLSPDPGLDYISPAVTGFVGYTPAEHRADPSLVGRLLHPEDRPFLEAALRGELPAGVPHVARWLHRDGRVVWTEHHIVTLRDDRGRPVAIEGISRDITKRMEAEAESRLRTRALEAAANAVLITDVQGIVLWANPAFTTLTGYSAQEVVGRNTHLLKSGMHDRAFYDGVWRTIGAGSVWSGEMVNRRKDGSLYTEEMTITPVKSETGAVTHFVAIKQDVTERRRAEAALRESEERFREIAETIQEVFWINDAQLSRTLYVSPAYEQVWGRSCQSLYDDPRSFLAAVHPADRDRVLNTFQGYERGDLDTVFRIVRPDGALRRLHARAFPVRDGDGRIVRMIGNARDVTQLHETEERLRMQKETLQTVVDNIPVAVNFMDATGRLLFANREWERLLGWSTAEAKGTDVLAACYPEPAEREAVRDFMRSAEGAWGDFRTRTRDGRLLDTAWANVRLSDGTFLGVGQDMTERRRLEAEYRQAQKMEAVGRLAGGVAHDFNNLLGVITGYGEFLRRKLPDDAQLRRYADEVLKAADRAAGLTRQLLAFSRKQVLQPRILDLNAVVAETEKMLRRLIGEDVQLVTALDERLGPVRADPGQVEQILMNLAVNARDAMPQGGRLSIETRNTELDEAFARHRPGVAPGRYVMLAVNDSGTGMTAEVKARIFEPFFTTKEQGKGTGLGLATVHGIVTQSGGHVWVDSEPGQGTTFKIFLPRSDRAQAVEAEAAAELPALARGSESVLIVEDEQSLRGLVRECVESAGYTTLEACDGRDALSLCAGRSEALSLLVTDVVMPKLGGRELAAQLQQRWPTMRVLYMSGYTDDAVVLNGVRAEHMDLLQKPFTAERLTRKIREVLDRPAAVSAETCCAS